MIVFRAVPVPVFSCILSFWFFCRSRYLLSPESTWAPQVVSTHGAGPWVALAPAPKGSKRETAEYDTVAPVLYSRVLPVILNE